MNLVKKLLARLLDENVEVDVQPPDLVVKTSLGFIVVRFIVGSEADFSLEQYDEAKLKFFLEGYSGLLDKLPEGSEIKVVKLGLNIDRFLAKISNEMMNLKATIDVVDEPHVKERSLVKLKVLKNIYESLLKGKKITQLVFILKIRGFGGKLDDVKRNLNVLSNIAINILQNDLGIKAREADGREIKDILKFELGLNVSMKSRSIVLDYGRVATLLPVPRFKKPFYDEPCVPLGADMETGWVVQLPLDALSKHVVVLGPTGRGKTTFLASLIEAVASLSDVKVVSIDFKGDLARLVSGLINVVNPRDYPLNIFVKPDLFDELDWLLAVTDILSNVVGVEKRVLVDIVPKYIRRTPGFMDNGLSIDNRDLVFLSNIVELAINKPRYDEVFKSLSDNVIFNLDGYGSSFQNCYGGLIVHLYKKYALTGSSDGGVKRILVIDEAWRISRLSGLLELVKEGRSRGVGVVLASQNPSDIPREVVENAQTIIMFGSVNEDYQRDAQRILGLPQKVINKLSYLGVGEAILINALNPKYVVLKVRPPLKVQGEEFK